MCFADKRKRSMQLIAQQRIWILPTLSVRYHMTSWSSQMGSRDLGQSFPMHLQKPNTLMEETDMD